jgi:hypothetical protein
MPWAPVSEILADRGLDQVGQRQPVALAMQEQVLLDGCERVLADLNLDRSIRAQQEQPGRAGPSRQIGDQIQRRIVGPVKVLEPEHEETLSAQRLQRLRHFAQHSLGHCAGRLTP